MSSIATTDKCPAYSAFFGVMGATSAMIFSGGFYFYVKLTMGNFDEGF